MCLGIPGQIISTYSENNLLMARVGFSGIIKQVCIEHVPEAQVGDYVLVHVGFALARLDEQEARRVFALLEELAQLSDLQEPDEP